MTVAILIVAVIFSGVFVSYLYFIAPRRNPANKAELFIQENRIDEAIVELKKVIEKAPYDINVHKRLADLYMRQGMEEQASRHFEKLIEINRFSADVVKGEIYRSLARIYLKNGQVDKAFGKYYELLKDYPADSESLYHVGFISLGQEIFETAFKSLDSLAKQEKKNFEVLFGAGIAALQSQRISEAINYFGEAVAVEPESDIANIAMAYTFYKKRDYKTAVDYVKAVTDKTSDSTAMMIAKRLTAFCFVELKKYSIALKYFEEIRNFCVEHNWDEELRFTLFDLGFASLLNDNSEEAYDYWNQLYQLERNYKNLQDLITRLRKEMDERSLKFDDIKPVVSEAPLWKDKAFPENFMWNICGLKSDKAIDIAGIITSGRVSVQRERRDSAESDSGVNLDFEAFYKLDSENFRSVSYRMCEKLGFVIDEILNTYRESDGVDFLAINKENKNKTLIWVRRWKGTNVGEIPLRNFAQAINDAKAKQGYFITTSPLTPAGEGILKNLDKVVVIYPEEALRIIKGIMQEYRPS